MKRYSRNIALAEIGPDGQDALLESSVLVIGAGGLGSPVMLYLAAAGVGKIGIVDSDRVEISNLQRQILYGENSIGKSKVDETEAAIHRLNKDIEVVKYKTRFGKGAASLTDEDNNPLSLETTHTGHDAAIHIAAIGKSESNPASCLLPHATFSSYDIIADCSDNFSTRFLINQTCLAYKKTLVSGAVTGFTGQVSTFKPYLGGNNPCYQCFCPEMPPEDLLPNCSTGGVLGSIAGVTGSIQATEIIKELLNIGESLSGKILIYDGLKGTTKNLILKKSSHCKCCN